MPKIYHIDDKRHKWIPSIGDFCYFYNFDYDIVVLDRFTGFQDGWPNGYAYCEFFDYDLPSVYLATINKDSR